MIHHPVATDSRQQIVDLTAALQKYVMQSKTMEGLLIVYNPHTTAAVTINENYDHDVKDDLLNKLSALIPKSENYYQHDEGNSDSHLKTAIVGNSATILIEKGQLFLGRWQGIYFCEFDGPRSREVVVKIVSWVE